MIKKKLNNCLKNFVMRIKILIIEIFDLNGSNVTRDCIVSWSGITSDHYTGKMDVHALPAGTYQCVVHNGKAHKATKFVVIK